jgi:hypothetical protein
LHVPQQICATGRGPFSAAVAAFLLLGAPSALGSDVGEETHVVETRAGETHVVETRTDETDIPGDSPFWIDLRGGYQNFGLRTLEGDGTRPTLIASRVDGPVADLGIGIRWLTLTLGVRGGVGDLRGMTSDGNAQDFRLWTLDAEVGFRIPAGRLEPHFSLGGGYSTFGGAREAVSGLNRGLDVSGANVRAGIGFDYYFSAAFSLGILGRGELMFLNRRGVPIRDLATPEQVATIGEAQTRALEGSGSSLGIGFAVLAGPALHF